MVVVVTFRCIPSVRSIIIIILSIFRYFHAPHFVLKPLVPSAYGPHSNVQVGDNGGGDVQDPNEDHRHGCVRTHGVFFGSTLSDT